MKKLAFGVDIGGINTAFGLVDEKGDLFGESVISTRAYPNYQDYPRYVADLCEAMKLLVAAVNFEFELIGIGVGAPNANFYKKPHYYSLFSHYLQQTNTCIPA